MFHPPIGLATVAAHAHDSAQSVGYWSLNWPLIIVLVAAVTAYQLAARAVTDRHPARPWPWRHSAFFLAGIAVLAFAAIGPLGTLDHQSFWAHMSQHILVMMLSAPLLLLGQPVLLLLRYVSAKTRHDVVVPILRSRFVATITHPAVSWTIFAVVLIGSHVTGFFEYSLEHDWVHHLVEHPLYLSAGLIYFYPLLGVGPRTSAIQPFAKVISLFAMMLPEVVLGFAIYTSSSVLYPYYAEVTQRDVGPANALDDQRLAGALMWSSGMLFNAVWISVAVWEWLKAEEHKGLRVDAAIRAEALAEARGEID